MMQTEPAGRLSVRASRQGRPAALALAQPEAEQAVDVVRGKDPAARRLAQLVAGAGRELLIINGGTHAGHFPRSLLRAAIARGVHVRSIYARDLLATSDGGTAPPIEIVSGEQARAMHSVPVTYLLVDVSTAATPLTVDDTGQIRSLLVISRSALLDTGVALAENLWRQAEAVGESGYAVDTVRPPSPTDAVLLELLERGLKDRAIARAIGIGERTVQRRLSTLMDELGAKTRFQAALLAVRRGWL